MARSPPAVTRSAIRGHRKGVEGLEVERVGDVHDDLAGQLVTTLGDDIGNRRIGHREHDDVACDRLVCIGGVVHLNRVATLGRDVGDDRTHVAFAEDAHLCHDLTLPRAGRPKHPDPGCRRRAGRLPRCWL